MGASAICLDTKIADGEDIGRVASRSPNPLKPNQRMETFNGARSSYPRLTNCESDVPTSKKVMLIVRRLDRPGGVDPTQLTAPKCRASILRKIYLGSTSFTPWGARRIVAIGSFR